jgi:hypothetical protein
MSPFEKVVADLTMRSSELVGFGSLTETIEALRQLRKDSLTVCKAATETAKNTATRAVVDIKALLRLC